MDAAVAPSFKGIALFTPGGDCVYCIDEHKRAHWHLDLCAALQRHLDLVEPPYFLLPCYTATVDRWVSPGSDRCSTVAEAYPRVMPFQPLLNVLFGLGDWQWQPNYGHRDECSVALINSYRSRFPQLWDCHDLILQVDAAPRTQVPVVPGASAAEVDRLAAGEEEPHCYKLFVNGLDTAATEQMLRLLHTTLEASLPNAYTLQVFDVSTHPAEAEAAHISATPTLIQVSPQPVRRVVGKVLSQAHMLRLLGHG